MLFFILLLAGCSTINKFSTPEKPTQVKNLMQSAAMEHPNVMHKPEPMVVLDDLGDNALIFTLRYWIRIQNGTDGRRVDSDLRCEILEKLNGAGIDVPYPQRDIHLSASTPLPVSVVPPSEAGAKPPA